MDSVPKSDAFWDTHIANQILQSETPCEYKKLSHQIHSINHNKWSSEGLDLCLKGVCAKFCQKKDLFSMLKTTEPKMLVEASSDKLLSTRIPLNDTHVVNENHWSSKGWLSDMLHIIREEYKP